MPAISSSSVQRSIQEFVWCSNSSLLAHSKLRCPSGEGARLEIGPSTRVDAHQIPPTQFRSTTFRNIDVRRRVLVNDRVNPGFRRVCDTVLTQSRFALARTHQHTRTATSCVPTLLRSLVSSATKRAELLQKLFEAHSRVRFGYRRLLVLLRREGWDLGKKRLYRNSEAEIYDQFLDPLTGHSEVTRW